MIKCQLNGKNFHCSRIKKIYDEVICYTGFGDCVTICEDELEEFIYSGLPSFNIGQPPNPIDTIFDLFCAGEIIKTDLGYISDWSVKFTLTGVDSLSIERDIINRFGNKYNLCRGFLSLPIVSKKEDDIEFGLYIPDKNKVVVLEDLFWLCRGEKEFFDVYENIMRKLNSQNDR